MEDNQENPIKHLFDSIPFLHKSPPKPILVKPGVVTESEKPVDIAVSSDYTDRSYESYLKILDIKQEDLGNKVLDIGSGATELFSKEAATLGIEVTNVNPQLSIKEFRDMAKENSQGRSVAAIVQNLPFTDSTFDTVVSVVSVPFHLDRKDFEKAFSEIYRVLKPGGKAILAPIDVVDQGIERNLHSLDIPFNLIEMKKDEIDEMYKGVSEFVPPNDRPPYNRLVIEKPQSL